jgi:hypothetical protein
VLPRHNVLQSAFPKRRTQPKGTPSATRNSSTPTS